MEENAAIDIPDERDVPYEGLMGSLETVSIAFPKDKLVIQNQGAEAVTKMACSRFGMAHIVNGQSILADGTQELKGIDLWKRYLQKNPNAQFHGASLQSMLNQATKEKLIGGYASVETEAQAKLALDCGHYIYTGSFNGDWTYVRDTSKYRLRSDGRVVGHVWVIVGYDHTGFTAINSYGPKNGYFTLPYDLYKTTFTKYAILPAKEIDPIITYRNRLMENISIDAAKQALANNFWNGERPKDAASREEVAAMIERLYEKLKP